MVAIPAHAQRAERQEPPVGRLIEAKTDRGMTPRDWAVKQGKDRIRYRLLSNSEIARVID